MYREEVLDRIEAPPPPAEVSLFVSVRWRWDSYELKLFFFPAERYFYDRRLCLL